MRAGAATRATVAVLALLLSAGAAWAFEPPPIQGHVTDTAGVLDAGRRGQLEERLTRLRQETGYEIAVFFTASLQGESVQDAAYTTFNTWKIGKKGEDNGVLLLVAPNERQVWMETGKGVGGELTDVQAYDIIKQSIAPRLKAGQYDDAAEDGSNAIARALTGQPLPGAAALPDARTTAGRSTRGEPVGGVDVGGWFCLFVPVLLFFILMSSLRGGGRGRRRRGIFFGGWGWGGGGGWGRGGGWGGGGGSGGGGGGGGYSGGGGSSGGGGAGGGY